METPDKPTPEPLDTVIASAAIDTLRALLRDYDLAYSDAMRGKQNKMPEIAHDIVANVASLMVEFDRLGRWKTEALPVIAGLQELGKALDLLLGEQITGPKATEAALSMRSRIKNAVTEIEWLQAQVALRDSVIDYWHEEATRLLYDKKTAKTERDAAREALTAERKAWTDALGIPEQRADSVRAMLLDAADRMADQNHRGNSHAWPRHARMLRNLAGLIDQSAKSKPRCDHPGIEHGQFSYTGVCPRCKECKFIGHGPMCGDCYLRQPATDEGAGVSGPHSKACGIKPHEHGRGCHAKCPTCYGTEVRP